MNRSGFTTRVPAAGMLAAAAASGLVLAGCGTHSGSSAASSSGSASSPAAAGASGASPASPSPASPSQGSSTTVSTSTIFPLAVGNTWVYDEQLNSESGTVSNEVTSVTPAAAGNTVAMKMKDDLLGVHTTHTSVFVVHPDGSLSVPLTQLGSTQVQVKSGSLIWPSSAQLASGQPHDDTLVIAFKEGGRPVTVTAHVVVKGEGTRTVSVPAGTYQATLINQTMTEKFSGIAVGTDIRTWVANGVGPVKSEVTTNEGGRATIADVQELKSFTRG